jgi:hypothetical protein
VGQILKGNQANEKFAKRYAGANNNIVSVSSSRKS